MPTISIEQLSIESARYPERLFLERHSSLSTGVSLNDMHVEKNIPSRTRARPGRTKDFLLYVAIAIAVVMVVVTFAFHQAKTGGSPDLPLKWMGFAGMTAIVFGYAIRDGRRKWHLPKFWLFLGLFFALHTILGIIVLLSVTKMPLVIFGALTGVEYLILAKYLDYFALWPNR
jgi:hypothetical protein